MSVWSEVRLEARKCRARLNVNSNSTARELIGAAEKDTGIKVCACPDGDVLLEGAQAVYHRDSKRIYYSSVLDARLAAFYIAHEFAHHWLDEMASQCTGADVDIATPGEPEMSWVGDPDTYSPKERAEALANVYARELLLPRPWLRALCNEAPFDAGAIAESVGVPLELVMQQLCDSLLLPEEPESEAQIEPERNPDDTQRLAIEAPGGPLRVLAGPGTGKTRTLIGRSTHLVENGIDPHSIAILTFSNLSSQDLSVRLRLSLGERATALWVGTFHAFGLELLRKYGAVLGLNEDLRLIDRSGSMDLLLELLPSFELDHFLDLHEPLRGLGRVAGLISRAKDELKTPEEYEVAAKAQALSDPEKGAQSLEVARAYAVYDAALRERGWLDFGDLIARSVELLRQHPEVATDIRTHYKHVLVDEYQDMNRASGIFLTLLTEPEYGPWVVGDVRQAIYRFRGASPLNLENFGKDFPGAKEQQLQVNYRSLGKIVRTFETFGGGSPLVADRGEGLGKVELRVASTFLAECEGIANAILVHQAQGGQFRDHAILARSHTTLGLLALHLEARGVPCLYFGDFFERPEIRDLLSLLQLASEPTGVGLVRVARFPEYELADSDLSTLLSFQREQEDETRILDTLRTIDEVPGISSQGLDILKRLTADLQDVHFGQKPHAFLMNFLFRRGTYLAPLLADESVAAQQKRLAIFQLLQFCGDFRCAPGADSKRLFLDHVRRLEFLDEEKQLRGLPAAASGIDAVRLMTIHASKGLQFPIVHLLRLTTRHIPVKRSDLYALPPSLLNSSAIMSREAEETALFFVALSRARDELHLSYAIDNGKGSWKTCKPSDYLALIQAHLSVAPGSAPSWTQEGPPIAEPFEDLPAPPTPDSWGAQAIETYLDCPRKFYYREILGLQPREGRNAFLKTHSALRATIEWLQNTTAEKRAAGLKDQFTADWTDKGPSNHALGALYLRAAEKMIETASRLMRGEVLPSELTLTLDGGVRVTVRADHISSSGGQVRIQRLKQGKLAKSGEDPKLRYDVQKAATRQTYPTASIEFEHVSLLSAQSVPVKNDEKKLDAAITNLKGAIANIAAGRFAATPNSTCPQCDFYFICPNHFRLERTTG